MTDETNGTLLYDNLCGLCRCWAARLSPILRRRGIVLHPLPSDRVWDEMKLQLATGKTLGGADAAVYIARRVWWAWPVWALSRLPGAMPAFQWIYRRVAANRHCRLKHKPSVWLALLLPAVACAWQPILPDWGFMWVMVGALVAGSMWVSGWRPNFETGRVTYGVRNALLGAVIFWGLARWVTGDLARGWTGMVGLVLMIHFGLVQCLTRIMREPLRARSVSEFWGRRWNQVFPEMMRPLVFEPVRRVAGWAVATMTVFGVSGLLHELVISLPTRGGYGLPTVYFLIQGLGALLERKMTAGYRRVFAWVIVVGPMFWLFHPLFVKRVVIPMMEALGAL